MQSGGGGGRQPQRLLAAEWQRHPLPLHVKNEEPGPRLCPRHDAGVHNQQHVHQFLARGGRRGAGKGQQGQGRGSGERRQLTGMMQWRDAHPMQLRVPVLSRSDKGAVHGALGCCSQESQQRSNRRHAPHIHIAPSPGKRGHTCSLRTHANRKATARKNKTKKRPVQAPTHLHERHLHLVGRGRQEHVGRHGATQATRVRVSGTVAERWRKSPALHKKSEPREVAARTVSEVECTAAQQLG